MEEKKKCNLKERGGPKVRAIRFAKEDNYLGVEAAQVSVEQGNAAPC